MALLEVGQTAPAFTAFTDDGRQVSLSDFKGHPVVMYFYPKADTPGCTAESCAFRDHYGEFQTAGVTVLGVSGDNQADQAAFKAKYHLPFTLLADTEHTILNAYGVWGNWKRTTSAGVEMEFTGIYRVTYVIDGNGTIVQVLKDIDPASHSKEVLAQLAAN